MKLQHVLVTTGILMATLFLTACASSGGGPQAVSADPIPGTWIDVDVSGDTVTVPLVMIEEHENIHFTLEADGGSFTFMVYLLEGEVQVRANACPPCRSRGFTLHGYILDCDACDTTFDARDGRGIGGPCKDYPKARAPHRLVDGVISMSLSDLIEVYEETLVAG